MFALKERVKGLRGACAHSGERVKGCLCVLGGDAQGKGKGAEGIQ